MKHAVETGSGVMIYCNGSDQRVGRQQQVNTLPHMRHTTMDEPVFSMR
jgi:hypothetical protein